MEVKLGLDNLLKGGSCGVPIKQLGGKKKPSKKAAKKKPSKKPAKKASKKVVKKKASKKTKKH